MAQFTPSDLRKQILTMAYTGQSVHIGCAFSMVELSTVLYQDYFDAELFRKNDMNRHHICLSKGHGVMAFYTALSQYGIIGQADLDNYFKDGTLLTGLADAHVPGIEISGGSLGQGITVALGLALGKKLAKTSSRIFCVVGDGEMNEGSVWESLLIASHHKLSNFIVIVDANGFQAMGKNEDVLALGEIGKKFESFGYETLTCDGHSLEDLRSSLKTLSSSQSDKPKALVAKTIKGKGVSFMENDNIWHYTRLTEDTYRKALEELK